MVIETPKGLVHSVRITNKVFKAWSDGASEPIGLRKSATVLAVEVALRTEPGGAPILYAVSLDALKSLRDQLVSLDLEGLEKLHPG